MTRHHSKNTMFWRADEHLKALSRDDRWTGFHRACGRSGLFYDDIDPINDKPMKDVTDAMRGAGYQAIAFRIEPGYVQRFVSRGTGADAVAAVADAYARAVAAGDPVERGLEDILTRQPAADPFMELIG
jgi:hypothetical protein